MKQIFRVFFNFSLLLIGIKAIPEWKTHDISTLKLLQIVHRHGERTPLKTSFALNDPFRNETEYWKEGLGQLTIKGKYRMYKLGQFLRQNYDQYLGPTHSPREVYVRSSIEHRCIESVSCLLAGAYPPVTKDWQWNKGTDAELGLKWQPFPIETFMPKTDDPMLVPDKKCPNVDKEVKEIMNSHEVKRFLENYAKSNTSSRINKLFNETIETLGRGQQLWDTLSIELDRNYIWDNLSFETQKEYVSILEEFTRLSFVYEWNRDLIKNVRVGSLVETLLTNMQIIVNKTETDNNYKLFLYSTHDVIVAPLLQAFEVYNNLIPTYGSAVIFELHENKNKTNDYFVRIYYFNETLRREPYFLTSKNFTELYEKSKEKWFIKDFNKLCGINDKENDNFSNEMTFIAIGFGIGVTFVGLGSTVFFCIKKIIEKRNSSL
jgi:hypothetical protein